MRPDLFTSYNRYYDPTTDQFLSIDPDVASTDSPYIFTDDNSENCTDPLGLRPISVGVMTDQQVASSAPILEAISTDTLPALSLAISSGYSPTYSDPGQEAVDAAETQLGAPYIYGAEYSDSAASCIGPGTGKVYSLDVYERGPYQCSSARDSVSGDPGFDCSGLVQWAWSAAGVSIDRSTWQQVDNASKEGMSNVTLQNLEPGDLIYYENNGHVEMYIGNGEVIQAPETGQVVEETPLSTQGISAMLRP